MAETFDPAKKSANVTLTNGNLTATGTVNATYQNVESVDTHSTGKYYAQMHVDVNPAPGCLGIANLTASLANFAGVDTNSVGWVNDGRVLLNSATLTNIATWTTGDTISMAVDIGAKKVWFRTNAGGWNNDVIANQNPATGVGGISIAGLAAGPYALIVTLNGNTTAVTANFGATAYSQSVPSGYLNWDGTGTLLNPTARAIIVG